MIKIVLIRRFSKQIVLAEIDDLLSFIYDYLF